MQREEKGTELETRSIFLQERKNSFFQLIGRVVEYGPMDNWMKLSMKENSLICERKAYTEQGEENMLVRASIIEIPYDTIDKVTIYFRQKIIEIKAKRRCFFLEKGTCKISGAEPTEGEAFTEELKRLYILLWDGEMEWLMEHLPHQVNVKKKEWKSYQEKKKRDARKSQEWRETFEKMRELMEKTERERII